MAISGLELFQSSTSSLLGHGKFYPTKITVRHHQLRHLVRVTDGDKIYYVNDTDVFVLDIHANQSTLLATIPFEARCLAAGHGWVCTGGEQNGDCAFIRLEDTDGTPKCFGHDLNVDVLGGEIVNSMNIHLLRESKDADPEPVVLISNNDRSVKLYSLARREVLTTLQHDAPMNYATLSPDSALLAAVGDTNKVYFYKRRKMEPAQAKEQSLWPHPNFDWRPFSVPSVPTGDDVLDDHGFAIAFSPSGSLCAASSQGGAITVFDVNLLQDDAYLPEDAILCSFRSSRPTLWGCVRSMAFSPQPWDLLAWAEDHGRIGVADVRQMFVRRQIMSLDKEKSEIVVVDDATPGMYRDLSVKEKLKQQHLARLRSIRGTSSTAQSLDDFLEESRADVQQRRFRRRELMAYHRGLDLDARERSVVDALETTIDDVEHHMRPYSVNYTSPPRFRPSHLADPDSADIDTRLMTSSDGRGFRPYQPRRRTSVVLSDSTRRHLVPPDSPRARISASPGRMTDDEDPPSMYTNDLTPSHGAVTSQPQTSGIPVSDPWHVIQSALETARRSDESNADQPSLEQIETALEAERRLATQLEDQLFEERGLSSRLGRSLNPQNQMLQPQEREPTAVNDAGSHLEPAVDRFRRQLTIEREFGDIRTAELEEEIRMGNVRTLGLESVRARLLNIQPHLSDLSSTSSARSSALPLINTNSRAINSGSGVDLNTSPSTIISNSEGLRRQHTAHIENLEQQVRRAEARVRLAGSSLQSLENTMARSNELAASRMRDQQSSAQMRASVASRAAAASGPTRDATTAARDEDLNNAIYYQFITPGQTPRQNSEGATQSSDRATIPPQTDARRAATMERLRAWRANPTQSQSSPQSNNQPASNTEANATTRPTRSASELTGITSEREMRLARMMFLSSNARSTDANGNWVAGGGLQRMLNQASRGTPGVGSGAAAGQRPGGTAASADPGTATVADVVRDVGVGTAGIGWSEDGRSLFTGSEEGIFEFKVNLRDRMTFPAVEFR